MQVRNRSRYMAVHRTVVGVLALALTVPLSSAAFEQPAFAETVECTPRAATADLARQIALACTMDVVVEDQTDPWSSVTILSDGNTKVSSGIDAQRSPDPQDLEGDGDGWQPVDATLLAEPVAGRIVMAAPAVELTFSAGTVAHDGPLASLTTPGGHTVSLDVPFDLPSPVVTGEQAEYLDVFPGIDVVVTPSVDGSSFNEVIRASSPADLDIPELSGLTGEGLVFPIEVSDGLEVRTNGSGFDVVETASGEVVAESLGASAWDSAADQVLQPASAETIPEASSARTAAAGFVVAPDGEVIAADGVEARRAQAPVAGDETAPMEISIIDGAQTGVAVRLDPAALESMDGAIHVDPPLATKRPQGKAVIQSAYPNTTHYNDATSFPLGACTITIGCSPTNVVRSAFQWTDLDTISKLKGSDIVSADFTVFGQHSYNCTATSVELWRTGVINGSTTWNNFGPTSDKWFSKLESKTISHRASCDNDRDIVWNAKSAVVWAANNDSTRLTMGLKGISTSDPRSWKRYENPRLDIVYNRAPLAPASADMKILFEGGTYGCKTTTTGRAVMRSKTGLKVRGVGRDLDDGEQVRIRFTVVNNATGASVWESADTWGGAGLISKATPFEKSVQSSVLSDNVVYRWRMAVQDAGGRTMGYDKSPACYFEVDLTTPAMPVVTSNDYPEDEVSADTGTGTFSVGSGGTTDVVKYWYSWDTDSLEDDVDPPTAGGSVSLNFNPPGSGSHVLYVRSEDNAGRKSPVAKYWFSTGFPTAAGYWHLDEPAGTTTSADYSTGGNSLTVSSGVARGTGLLHEFDPVTYPDDKALTFDSSTDTAQSVGPVLNTSESFTVTAFVKPSAASDATQVAVSQDGLLHGGFKLGKLAGSNCPDGVNGQPMATCWGLWMYDTDGGGSAGLKAMSTIPVVANEWTHLAGVYDAGSGDMSLYVCHMGSASNAADRPQPVLGQVTEYSGTRWIAGGPVQVGRGKFNGAYRDNWTGAIDEVRLYAGAMDLGEIRNNCRGTQPGTGVGQIDDGTPEGDDDETDTGGTGEPGDGGTPAAASSQLSTDGAKTSEVED